MEGNTDIRISESCLNTPRGSPGEYLTSFRVPTDQFKEWKQDQSNRKKKSSTNWNEEPRGQGIERSSNQGEKITRPKKREIERKKYIFRFSVSQNL